MEVRSTYKQSELGVIPSDWEVFSLGSLGEALIGLTYKPSDVRPHGTLVLRSSNIQDGVLAFDDNVYVDCEIPERIKVRPGDVLVCVRNGSRNLIGKTALLDNRVQGMTFGAFMAVYRSKVGPLVNFLFQSEILKRQISEHLGATINQITNKSLNSFTIPIAPTDAERGLITGALSDIDAHIFGLDCLIKKKRDLKQAVMQQLLTGQIRLRGFTGEWQHIRAGEIGYFRGGNGFPNRFQGQATGNYPFYKVSDMNNDGNTTFMVDANNWISEDTKRKLGATAFPPESIIFAKVGAAVFLERKKILTQLSCIDNNLAALVLDKTKADVRFVHYSLLNIKFGGFVSTTALPSLSAAVLAQISFPLPSLPEQRAIATVLSDMDAELTALESRRDKAIALKQGMAQELLTGRIRLV